MLTSQPDEFVPGKQEAWLTTVLFTRTHLLFVDRNDRATWFLSVGKTILPSLLATNGKLICSEAGVETRRGSKFFRRSGMAGSSGTTTAHQGDRRTLKRLGTDCSVNQIRLDELPLSRRGLERA
ncbi:hypothetical protein CI238_12090 [Colletotrichum incanum]|uniref:Uncharacterized protein n=1 Tax=Colletotrichum incanum TaxID=1573173 RepID=A0A161W482_COLIC|nr:hypothetical protein CI238_12090 [Colletotrichum incanum]